jgi:DNA invertase Pin-like site-specific DNA recombinase
VLEGAPNDLIRERTSEGREAAKKRDVKFGRPRKLALDQQHDIHGQSIMDECQLPQNKKSTGRANLTAFGISGLVQYSSI